VVIPNWAQGCELTLVAALLAKYQLLKRLRTQHAAQPDAKPVQVLAQLAAHYPGALREIDILKPGKLEERIACLQRALAGEDDAPAWVWWMVRYHAWMRIALRVKRAARLDSDLQVLRKLELNEAPLQSAEPNLETLPEAIFAVLIKPPRGRLNAWVFEQLAHEFGTPAQEIERTLFTRD